MPAKRERISTQYGPFDASTWAKAARENDAIQRARARQAGLDEGKFAIADVLLTITGDDAQKFMTTRNHNANNRDIYGIDQHDGQFARKEQADILERLDWEAGTQELPANIRTLLKQTRDALREIDFAYEENVTKAYDLWKQMRDTIWKRTRRNPTLREAVIYTDQNWSKLPGNEGREYHWRNYLLNHWDRRRAA